MSKALFRGQTKKGKWVSGWGVVAISDKFASIPVECVCHGEPYIVHVNVKHKTIGAATLKLDINNNMIFADDIVEVDNSLCIKKIKQVKYSPDKGYNLPDKDNHNARFYSFTSTYRYRIIGNIHDNPELLKKKCI